MVLPRDGDAAFQKHMRIFADPEEPCGIIGAKLTTSRKHLWVSRSLSKIKRRKKDFWCVRTRSDLNWISFYVRAAEKAKLEAKKLILWERSEKCLVIEQTLSSIFSLTLSLRVILWALVVAT